jgi:hypothetical protein
MLGDPFGRQVEGEKIGTHGRVLAHSAYLAQGRCGNARCIGPIEVI